MVKGGRNKDDVRRLMLSGVVLGRFCGGGIGREESGEMLVKKCNFRK